MDAPLLVDVRQETDVDVEMQGSSDPGIREIERARPPAPSSGSSGHGGAPAMGVYQESALAGYLGQALAAARRCSPASRPGYAESLAARRILRRGLLVTVALVSLAADAARRGSGVSRADELVLLVLLATALLPSACEPCPWLPEYATVVAAVLHTFRGAARASHISSLLVNEAAGDEAIAVEHLAMFWAVALPLLGGTGCSAVIFYALAVLVFQMLLAGSHAEVLAVVAAVLLAIPVVASELQTAWVYARMQRGKQSVQCLLEGAGGASCAIDLTTGKVLKVRDVGHTGLDHVALNGQVFHELAEHADDRTRLRQLVRSASMAGVSGLGPSGCAPRLLRPLRVGRLRGFCEGGNDTAAALQLVPYDVSHQSHQLHILVLAQANRVSPISEIVAREQMLSAREEELSHKAEALTARELHTNDLEQALEEMHQLYEEGRRKQELPGQALATPEAEVSPTTSCLSACTADEEAFHDASAAVEHLHNSVVEGKTELQAEAAREITPKPPTTSPPTSPARRARTAAAASVTPAASANSWRTAALRRHADRDDVEVTASDPTEAPTEFYRMATPTADDDDDRARPSRVMQDSAAAVRRRLGPLLGEAEGGAPPPPLPMPLASSLPFSIGKKAASSIPQLQTLPPRPAYLPPLEPAREPTLPALAILPTQRSDGGVWPRGHAALHQPMLAPPAPRRDLDMDAPAAAGAQRGGARAARRPPVLGESEEDPSSFKVQASRTKRLAEDHREKALQAQRSLDEELVRQYCAVSSERE